MLKGRKPTGMYIQYSEAPYNSEFGKKSLNQILACLSSHRPTTVASDIIETQST